jgi:hypothetical protein
MSSPSAGLETIYRLVGCSCGRLWVSKYISVRWEPCPRCSLSAPRREKAIIHPALADVLQRLDAIMREDDGATSRNLWIASESDPDAVKIYIRLTNRLISAEEGMKSTIELASISIDEAYQGRGWFKTILGFVKSNCYSRAGVYVENVNNPRFHAYFKVRPEWRPVLGVANTYYQDFSHS